MDTYKFGFKNDGQLCLVDETIIQGEKRVFYAPISSYAGKIGSECDDIFKNNCKELQFFEPAFPKLYSLLEIAQFLNEREANNDLSYTIRAYSKLHPYAADIDHYITILSHGRPVFTISSSQSCDWFIAEKPNDKSRLYGAMRDLVDYVSHNGKIKQMEPPTRKKS